jgi:hypothetical protein
MTAQQLRDRLGAVFDDSIWQQVFAAQPNWLHHGYGDPLADIHTLVVHETSGLPGRGDAAGIFRHHFQTRPPVAPTAAHPHPAQPPPLDGITAQFDITGDGTVMQGMQPPRKSHHARPLNDTSIGSETGHAWGNYGGNDHQGPYISDGAGHLNAQPDNGAIPRPNKNGWVPLSGNDVANGPDDVPGVKFWAMADGGEVIVGSWTTANYAGPWREAQRVPEMLFSEAQYRGWALFARWICEEFLIPRNFAILPHQTRVTGYGLHGSTHSMLRNAVAFSTIVLADEGLSRSPATFGLPAGAVPSENDLQTQYSAAGAVVVRGPLDPHGDAHANDVNVRWEQACAAFRGIIGHGFSGDPTGDLGPDPHAPAPPPPPPMVRTLKDHDCPGPMFDWHRVAREVWDWWWHPFDLDGVNPSTVAVLPRPYSLASHDGNTPLLDYYWDTSTALMTGRVTPGIHGPHSSPSTFALPENSRVYAMAGGEVVAARFATANTGVDFSLLVVRHEVFHQLDPRPAAAAPPGGLPQFANRIDYDTAPASVYSLYLHLGRPAGMNFAAPVDANPDWLNRMLIRYQEATLGVAFRASAVGQAIPVGTWDNFPPGGGANARTSVDRSWTADHNNYGPTLTRLQRGDLTLMPGQRDVTPIRVLLGDYIGDVGVIRRDAAGAHFGVRVEVVSADVISHDFTETVTDATRLWDPVAGPAGTRHAVRYPSEWSANPTGAILAAMTAAGVTDTSLANWWSDVSLASTMHADWPDGASLPPGSVVHYDPYEFLPWLNARTWTSEWPKYRAQNLTNPGAVPATPIPRS